MQKSRKTGDKKRRPIKSRDSGSGRNRKKLSTNIGKGDTSRHYGSSRVIEGVVSISGKGLGYVRPTNLDGAPKNLKDEKIQIDPQFLRTALHGDTVRVLLHPKRPRYPQTGEISEILIRAKPGFAGVLEEENGVYFVVPSDTKMYTDIIIPKEFLGEAKLGQKVFCIIEKWTDHKKAPQGRIERVLGMPKENEAEMVAIALEKGFESGFPFEVEREVSDIKKKHFIGAEEKGRKDFRNVLTFTIDPYDAKDFDDAISFKELGKGMFEIGVHIADVSHYVRPGTNLDKEALARGTSVYLVDRTIPMLPEIISNNLCSLVPNEDRLTFSAVFEMDMEGRVKKSWYGKTIIHSDKRFTYEEAQKVLDDEQGLYYKELMTLNSIAKKLTKQRFSEGAISLDTEEVKFKLDERGVPIDVFVKQRGDTHKLIEEFMLLANKKVAEFIGKTEKGKDQKVFMYRIHDLPDKDRIKDLAFFLKKLGYEIKMQNNIIPPKEINRIIEILKGKEEKDAIHTAIIRSMAKAIYSTKNIGHFGLAFKYYTHFTSPIRRYPDLIVHRLLEQYLKGGRIKSDLAKEYERIAIFCSQREKEAADAERSSIKYKQVEYMSTRIGEEFDGIISGVTEWGLYVEERRTKCEGMVRMRDISDDFYSFNEKEMAIIGQKKKKKYRLGDKVKIKVVAANLDKKVIDYVFV